MKIYDVISHRSYEVNPKDINIKETREWGRKGIAERQVYVHPGSEYYDSRHAIFAVSEKTLKKITNTPRKSW